MQARTWLSDPNDWVQLFITCRIAKEKEKAPKISKPRSKRTRHAKTSFIKFENDTRELDLEYFNVLRMTYRTRTRLKLSFTRIAIYRNDYTLIRVFPFTCRPGTSFLEKCLDPAHGEQRPRHTYTQP